MIRPKITIKGQKELEQKLLRLGDARKMKRVLRKSTNAAGQVVVKAVRSNYPTDTGFSRRSVKAKVISTRAGYKAIVGVDRSAVMVRDDGTKHIPAKIDHLIEFGFMTDAGVSVPAAAPLRKGHAAAVTSAEARYAEKVGQEIEKEAAKK